MSDLEAIPNEILELILLASKYWDPPFPHRTNWSGFMRVCKKFHSVGSKIFLPEYRDIMAALNRPFEEPLMDLLEYPVISIREHERKSVILHIIRTSTPDTLKLVLSHPSFRITEGGRFELDVASGGAYPDAYSFASEVQSRLAGMLEVLLNTDGTDPNVPHAHDSAWLPFSATVLDSAMSGRNISAIMTLVRHPKVDLKRHPRFLSSLKRYAVSGNWECFREILSVISRERGLPIQDYIHFALHKTMKTISQSQILEGVNILYLMEQSKSAAIFERMIHQPCVDVSYNENDLLKRALDLDVSGPIEAILQHSDIRVEGIPVDKLYEYCSRHGHHDVILMMIENRKLEMIGKRMMMFGTYDEYRSPSRGQRRMYKRQKME